jgi:hypothetical protein
MSANHCWQRYNSLVSVAREIDQILQEKSCHNSLVADLKFSSLNSRKSWNDQFHMFIQNSDTIYVFHFVLGTEMNL